MADTLVLFNNSLVPGDFIVNPDGGGDGGQAIAYDNRSGELYIGTNEASLCVVSETTNEVVDIFEPYATVEYLTSIAYDYKDNEIFTEYTGTPGTVAVTSAATDKLVASITIGDVDEYDSNSLVYDSGTGEVFASNDGATTISVISTATNAVTTTINLPDETPRALGYDSGTHQVFVANVAFGDNVSVISDASDTLVKSIPDGDNPDAFAYDPAKGYVYVANGGIRANVSVLSDTTDTVVKTINLTATATAASYDPAQNEVYLTGTNVSVISDASNTVVATVALPPGALGSAYGSDDDEVWVLDGIPGLPIYASAISATSNTVVANALLTFVARYWAYDSAHQEEYIVDEASNLVAVVSDVTDRVVAMVYIPGQLEPYEAVYDSRKGEIFLSDKAFDRLTIMNDTTNTVVGNITLPGVNPTGMAYDPAKGEIFVGNAPGSNVTIISDATDTIVGVVSNVGNDPWTLAYDSGRGEIFAANMGDLPSEANVTVINDTTDTIVASVNASGIPESGMIYDGAKGEIFLPEFSYDTVSVISDATNKLVATIPTGTAAWGAAYDPTADEVFVGDANGDYENVTVISDLTDTTVGSIEPDGYTPASLAFDPTTGDLYTGDYTDGTVGIITPLSGSAPAHYAVTFTESGLPGGTSWSVTFNATLSSSTTSSIAYSVPNGSYSFTVGTVAGYTPSPASGPVTVSGGPVTESIDFTATPPTTYRVTFDEVGLPTGTTWTVTLQGSPSSSSSTSVQFSEGNGTYAFQVGAVSGYTAAPSSGSVEVNGGPVSKTITFSASTVPAPGTSSSGFLGLPGSDGYALLGGVAAALLAFLLFLADRRRKFPIVFNEAGLPPGTRWSVTLDSYELPAEGNTVVFKVHSGTHSYRVGSPPGFAPSPGTGTVEMKRERIEVDVRFAPVGPTR